MSILSLSVTNTISAPVSIYGQLESFIELHWLKILSYITDIDVILFHKILEDYHHLYKSPKDVAYCVGIPLEYCHS